MRGGFEGSYLLVGDRDAAVAGGGVEHRVHGRSGGVRQNREPSSNFRHHRKRVRSMECVARLGYLYLEG